MLTTFTQDKTEMDFDFLSIDMEYIHEQEATVNSSSPVVSKQSLVRPEVDAAWAVIYATVY